jgi:hypothetical protein
MELINYKEDEENWALGHLHSFVPLFYLANDGRVISDVIAIVIDQKDKKFKRVFFSDIEYISDGQ